MPITLSNKYDAREPTVGYEPRSGESIPFHKHCQATVCSAFGTDETGNGRSWPVLNNMPPLDNLPEGWKNRFKANRNNITQDFRVLLEIMNDALASGNQQSISFTVHPNGSDGEDNPVTLSQDGTIDLGRRVDLTIEGQSLSFNTLFPQEDKDVLEMSLPRHTLEFRSGSVVLDTVELPLSEDTHVDLGSSAVPGDQSQSGSSSGNYFPESEDSTNPLTISPWNSVYRVASMVNLAPRLDLEAYGEVDSGLVKIYLLVQNTGSSSIYVSVPTAVQSNFNTNPVLNSGDVDSGTIGMFSVVVDLYNKMITMEKETQYFSDPSVLTVVTFSDGTSRGGYFRGPLTVEKLSEAGFISENQWVKNPVEVRLGRGVTEIGDDVFADCTTLTYIGPNSSSKSGETWPTLPDSITRIGARAFRRCSITNISIPDSVGFIGEGCFFGCESLEEITIPFIGESKTYNTANGIPDPDQKYVFGYIFGGQSSSGGTIYAGSTLVEQQWGTTAQKYACYIPSSLRKVTLRNNQVCLIPQGAFDGCSMIQNIDLASRISIVQSNAFRGCQGLTRLAIPDGTQSMAAASLAGTKSLAYLKIPFVGTSAGATQYETLFGSLFQAVSSSTAIQGYIYVAQTYSDSATSKGYSIPSGLKEVVVTGNVLTYGAFQNCTMIETLTLSGNPTQIPNRAFKTTGITKIVIPDSVTSIGKEAFMNTPLSEIRTGSGLTSIAADAFKGIASTSTRKLYVNDIDQWLSMQYPSATDNSYWFNHTGESELYALNQSSRQYELVESLYVTSNVPPYAFSGCRGIQWARFSYDLQIGKFAFYGCSGLRGADPGEYSDEERLWIPGDVSVSVGASAFQNCTSLKDVFVGSMESEYSTENNVIGTNAFQGCTGMESLTLILIKTLGNSAFKGCSSLKNVSFYKTRASSIQTPSYTNASSPFNGCTIETLRVDSNDFLNAVGRVNTLFGSGIKSLEIGDSVTAITSGALKTLVNLQSLTVPFVGTAKTATGKNRSMGAIFGSATYGTVGTTTYTAVYEGNTSSSSDDTYWIIPMSLATINVTSDSGKLPDQAFQYFEHLRSVSLNSEITQIGKQAFFRCDSLDTLNFAGNITNIGDSAFAGTGINRIEMPYVTHIGQGAFWGCENLNYVQFNGITNPDEILEDAFFREGTPIQEVHLEGLTYNQIVDRREYWALSCVYVYFQGGREYL